MMDRVKAESANVCFLQARQKILIFWFLAQTRLQVSTSQKTLSGFNAILGNCIQMSLGG